VGTRDEALLTLALRTGMRQGELAALRWEDVDLTGKPTITVRLSADTRTKTRVSTTKTGKERKIHIGPRTVDVLKGHRARQLEERMAAASWVDPGLVFPNTRGKIRRRDSVMRSLRRFLEEAGLPVDVRFHDLRHTAGTLALRQGVPLHTVSRMLGHSDPQEVCPRPRGHARGRSEGDGRALLKSYCFLLGLTTRSVQWPLSCSLASSLRFLILALYSLSSAIVDFTS
jgi:integrase